MKKYKAICPLIGFQIPWNVLTGHADLSREETKAIFEKQRERVVEGINLLKGVKIRLASKEDLADLNTICFDPFGPREKYSPNTFVMVKHYEGRMNPEHEQIMRNTVLALRLLKRGYVSSGHIFHILLTKNRVALTSIGERRPRRFVYNYGLEFKEIKELRRILKKLQAVDFTKRRSLGLACRRFQRAYEEEDWEDRLIDFMIALEALFLRGERRGSSHGRIIAVACSCLLGENEENRNIIKKNLTDAYGIRNKIVHGSYHMLSPRREEDHTDFPSDIVSDVEDYLRESIRKFLD